MKTTDLQTIMYRIVTLYKDISRIKDIYIDTDMNIGIIETEDNEFIIDFDKNKIL